MKKFLTGLAILTTTGVVANPIIATIYQTNLKQQQHPSNPADSYKTYQTKTDWENYMNKNHDFINLLKKIGDISPDYNYTGCSLALETINDPESKLILPVGTLLMNGKIHTTIGNPDMATQHIIDNSQGSSPLTINYDAKTITNTSTVSASIATEDGVSVTATGTWGLPFDNASVSTTLAFNTTKSHSTTASVQQTITFDKFSTTIKPGDKSEIDYLVMQNCQVFNMVLKTKLDLNSCKFNFVNKAGDTRVISWFDLANEKSNNQTFAQQITNSINAAEKIKNIQPFISVDKINDPTVPTASQYYDANTVNIYLPLSFTIDGYSTLITQTKLANNI